MPSKFLNSLLERKSSKVKQFVPPAISPPNPPKTLSKEDKPLPLIPNLSIGALGRLLPRMRDSLILPRVLGSLNRGLKRVRRHSLVLSAAGLGLTIPVSKKITGMETDDKFATNTDIDTITPLLLTSTEVEPEVVIAEDDEGVGEEEEDEEMEVRHAVEMTILPVRARLIYIGGKGSTS